MINALPGTTQVIVELSRKEVGAQLEPPVTDRMVRIYLDYASLYLPSFARFRDEELGGLNGYTKITLWDLPVLQRIRTYARERGMKRLRIGLSTDPHYFLLGDSEHATRSTDDCEEGGGEVRTATAKAA